MAKKKSRKKKDTEEVCEVFEIEKKGKEKEKKVCNVVEKKHATKEEIKRQNKTLRNILIGLLIIVLLILGAIYIINSAKSFTYRGIKGNVVKKGDIIFYQFSFFPVKYQGKIVTYNIYIRNDPRKLDRIIPFEGEMDFGAIFNKSYHILAVNISDDFTCEGDKQGDDIISLANMANLGALGIKVMGDDNATCDPEGRYMYINIKEGEESKITQIGESCYDLVVKDCEILKVTERFMVEAFVKYNEQVNAS